MPRWTGASRLKRQTAGIVPRSRILLEVGHQELVQLSVIPPQGQCGLEEGLDRHAQEFHWVVRAVLVENRLAAEHLRDLALADFDPALGRRIVESQRNAIEARLLQVEKMGELVEPDVVRVVGISETLAQGRHRQDHGAPGVRLAGALPVSEEQALALVKSGFTNLEGLRDADVQDLVDILAVDETKAREIYDAVHRQEVVH